MHLVAGTSNAETIRAEMAYDEQYRFRLWLAAVEDSTKLRMGFRAYLSHVRSSLDLWERSGIKFANPKGEKLNLDALKSDDLWGFLGKKDKRPQGPGRTIDATKVAVIDVYMKRKFPALAATFDKAALSPELAAVLRTFFDGGLASEPFADYVSPWSGIYLRGGKLDAKSIVEARRKGEVPKFVLRAIMLQPSDRPDFCIVHKVILPFLPHYVNDRDAKHEDWSNVSKLISRHAANDTVIYSGIALVSYGGKVTKSDVRLALMLRDRTTYEPYLSQLTIKRRDEGLEETRRHASHAFESIGESTIDAYSYCGRKDHRSNIMTQEYSSELFKELDRLYTLLGEDV